MATLQQLEQALIAADKAGNMDDARKLAVAVKAAREDVVNQIPGMEVPGTQAQAPEPSAMDQIIGAGETALTLGTGAIGGTVGMLGGAARGFGTAIVNDEFGTQKGVQTIQNMASQGAQALTYEPKTQAGRDQVGAVGSALEAIPPIIPVVGPVGAMGASVQAARPMVTQAVKNAAAPVIAASRKAVAPIVNALERAPKGGVRGGPAAGGSMGAAGTRLEAQRIATGESLPVPLTGSAALTKGQATRDAGTIKFEKEIMQQGDNGAPIRTRVENQAAVLEKNFQTLVDRIDPATTEIRDLGKNVDSVLKNKMGVANRQISKAYQKARDAGEMEEPIQHAPLVPVMDDLDRFAGVAANVNPIRREAARLGAIADNGSGGLVPGTITLDQSELLRQFVNQATDWTDKRQSMVAKRINESIDLAMDGAGGEAYKAARKLKTDYMREFENVGLTKKLTTTKRGTDERRVAYADVFETIMIDSPVEEMNKLRRTLITAGPDGKQAWSDLKAKGIEYIKEKSSSKSSTDQRGNATLSVDKLNSVIGKMDSEGKLESLYGKKQAQTLRDLAEMSKVIYTAPPGAINTSGTASAIITALDTFGTFGLTGIPVPAVAVLKQSAKYIKNREVRNRINESLNYTTQTP